MNIYNLVIRGSKQVHSFEDYTTAVRVAHEVTGYDAISLPEHNVCVLFRQGEPVGAMELIDEAPTARVLSA